jgi:hypothetical protein
MGKACLWREDKRMNRSRSHHTSDQPSRLSRAPWKRALYATLVALALLVCYVGIRSTAAHEAATVAAVVAPQNAISGEWIIETRSASDNLYLTIQRGDKGEGRHFHSSSSFDIKQDSLKGLSVATMRSNGSPVQFQIVRDAGTFNCEGYFKNGNGSGHFTFAPSQSFAAQMESLGYGKLTDEQLFSLAVIDVQLAFVRDLAALGYDHLSLDNLIAMRIHGAGPQFISEIKAAGYDRLPVDELIAMRIHGVTPDYIREVKSLGYDKPEIDQLVAMRIHGVSAEFMRGLQELGYERPPIDDLVAMRIHGVSTEFIKEIKAQGYDRVPVDQLVAMRIHGVNAAYIEKMKARGLSDLTIDKLIELRIHGFDK